MYEPITLLVHLALSLDLDISSQVSLNTFFHVRLSPNHFLVDCYLLLSGFHKCCLLIKHQRHLRPLLAQKRHATGRSTRHRFLGLPPRLPPLDNRINPLPELLIGAASLPPDRIRLWSSYHHCLQRRDYAKLLLLRSRVITTI